jgi:hypothetical protein
MRRQYDGTVGTTRYVPHTHDVYCLSMDLSSDDDSTLVSWLMSRRQQEGNTEFILTRNTEG